MMSLLTIAFAQAQQGSPRAGPFWGLFPFIVVIILFYVLLVVPQQRRVKKHKEMLAALKKGDKVITQAGLLGTVVGITKTLVTLQVADNVRLRMQKEALTEIQS